MNANECNRDAQPALPPSTCSAATDGVVIAGVIRKHTHDDRKMTTMEDAILMLDLWDICICKNIKVQKYSPLHRLVKWTLEDMRQNNSTGGK